MNTLVSYPDRGFGGRNTYRGNCSGRLIEDIIDQYRLRGLSDFMVGSGTTEDVVRRRGLRGDFADLNRGFDMLTMDIPERAENIMWHPPYHNLVVYSGQQYSDKEVIDRYGFDPKVSDLSRCKDWEDFIRKLNYCMFKQFAALEKGGRMFTLVGDIKQSGRLYSMIADMAKPGTMEQIIIKAQHNCTSDGRSYAGRFVPIVHEYLLVTRKDSSLLIPVRWTEQTTEDVRDSNGASWRDIILAVIEEEGGEAGLELLYERMDGHRKAAHNPHWREKIRQTVQNAKYFTRTARGRYSAA